MDNHVELLSMTREELEAVLTELGQPRFRASQLFGWLHKGTPPEEMRNLPGALRERLSQEFVCNPVSIIESRQSQLDGTVKFLYALRDGNVIEGVLMHYHYGYTLCLSTQVGCRMGCRFCASTLEGCVRGLSAGEMLGQILCANTFLHTSGIEEKVGNIVLMGSGEPFDNYENVIRFLRLLRDPEGICIGMRSVSLSTCGLVPEMLRFCEEELPVTLCISLHAPTDEIRRQIMPIARKYSMQEVLGACRQYVKKTGRRIIFEYAMIDGVNSSVQQAEQLAKCLHGFQCHVNLIPLNAVPERGLRGVSEETVRRFLSELTARGISATRRREMGDDINGACGQLRRSYIKGKDQASL